MKMLEPGLEMDVGAAVALVLVEPHSARRHGRPNLLYISFSLFLSPLSLQSPTGPGLNDLGRSLGTASSPTRGVPVRVCSAIPLWLSRLIRGPRAVRPAHFRRSRSDTLPPTGGESKAWPGAASDVLCSSEREGTAWTWTLFSVRLPISVLPLALAASGRSWSRDLQRAGGGSRMNPPPFLSRSSTSPEMRRRPVPGR